MIKAKRSPKEVFKKRTTATNSRCDKSSSYYKVCEANWFRTCIWYANNITQLKNFEIFRRISRPCLFFYLIRKMDCQEYFYILLFDFYMLIELLLPHSGRQIQKRTFVLIFDWSKGRDNFLSALLLYLFDIDLHILSSHSSHLLQPFDIAVAAQLKAWQKHKTNYKYGMDF